MTIDEITKLKNDVLERNRPYTVPNAIDMKVAVALQELLNVLTERELLGR